MKKHSLSMILFIIISFSCTNNEPTKNESANSIDYNILSKSMDRQISTFNTIMTNSNNGENFLKYFKTQPLTLNSSKNIPREKTIKIKLASHYNKKENKFMLSFYEDLANSYDSQIIELLNSKRILLNNNDFSINFRNEANFLFNTIEKITNEINAVSNKSYTNKTGKTNGFFDCIVTKEGKNIGRGIAIGAIGGAISGAGIGAGGGTVVLPGIGTAAGAIGGAVFGAAKGAIAGGLGALVWSAADCISEIKRYEEPIYFYFDEFYNEVIYPNDPNQINLYMFEDYDPLTNSILFTPDDSFIKFIE